jgi:hypothetical protein
MVAFCSLHIGSGVKAEIKDGLLRIRQPRDGWTIPVVAPDSPAGTDCQPLSCRLQVAVYSVHYACWPSPLQAHLNQPRRAPASAASDADPRAQLAMQKRRGDVNRMSGVNPSFALRAAARASAKGGRMGCDS